MKKKMNCDNCGAPLHGHRCEYCGTEYEFDDVIKLRYETSYIDFDTFGVRVEVPREMTFIEGAEYEVKSEISKKIANRILDYCEFETWIDPCKLAQVVGAKVRVGRPRRS